MVPPAYPEADHATPTSAHRTGGIESGAVVLNMIHLQTLQAVLRAGSLSEAGRQLGYTTSAVSQQVAALERSLNLSLFIRGPRSLQPTAAALHLGKHADTLLLDMAAAEEQMREFSEGQRGGLRITAFPTVGAQLLPRALARLVHKHPRASFSLQEDQQPELVMEAVREGRSDLGLVYEYGHVPTPRPGGLEVGAVLDEELVIIHGPMHPRLPDPLGGFAELAGEIWVSNQPGSAAHENLHRLCTQAGFEPETRFTSNDYDVIRGLVRESLGVALVPALALGTDRDISMRRFGADDAPRRGVLAVARSNDPNPLIEVALTAIRSAAHEFVRWTEHAFAVRIESPLATVVPG